jgi:hypothetical protein
LNEIKGVAVKEEGNGYLKSESILKVGEVRQQTEASVYQVFRVTRKRRQLGKSLQRNTERKKELGNAMNDVGTFEPCSRKEGMFYAFERC